jgi:hypothetical protein
MYVGDFTLLLVCNACAIYSEMLVASRILIYDHTALLEYVLFKEFVIILLRKSTNGQTWWLFLVSDNQWRWSDTVFWLLFCVHEPMLRHFRLVIKSHHVIPRSAGPPWSAGPTCVHIWPCSFPLALFIFLKTEPGNWFHCYSLKCC